MDTVRGIAREALPLAKQEFPLLDAKFKGDQYNNLIAWLRTPVKKSGGVGDQIGKAKPVMRAPTLAELHEIFLS